MRNKYFTFLAFVLLCNAPQAQLKTEFRGVWIATVTNIDWPETNMRDGESQKASFIKLLDEHKKNGINAIIMQIRPAADALYHSTMEPWSHWFTGKQGLPPQPWYDPLEFMISETHKRNMEFHAWLNPYRAVFNVNTNDPAPTHVTRIHPEWFVKYGDKLYFDPSNQETRKFVAHIVRDLVKRYEVDAIHFDDYFYPYKIAGKEFPDEATYRKSGTKLSKADWRRSNVDSIISLVSRTIRKYKPGCEFGISPFGVWRNSDKDPLRGSKTRAGVTNYDDLYADILLWMKNDWIDYVAPQIYWETTSRAVPFDTIVEWWNQNTCGKKCYIGIGIYRADTNNAWRKKDELPKQIQKIRSLPNLQGMAFYSSKVLVKNPNGWTDSLRQHYFKQPALPSSVRK